MHPTYAHRLATQNSSMMRMYCFIYHFYLIRAIQIQLIDNQSKDNKKPKTKIKKHHYDATRNILITKGIANGAMSAAFNEAKNVSEFIRPLHNDTKIL